MSKPSVIPCCLSPETRKRIEDFSEALTANAHAIGGHGLSRKEFDRSGLLRAAIERLRGQQAASMNEKRTFIASKLDAMRDRGAISSWAFSGSADRHDYEIRMPDGRVCVVEAKGCLDGNNTNIFERPPHADEFIIWSLCQNPGADPRHNVWSGIHTRLSAETIHRKVQVDGLIVWDMLCGTAGRPCPKLENVEDAAPPCIYLFPRSISDPRNNPDPPMRRLGESSFLSAMAEAFQCGPKSIHMVRIESRYEENALVRRSTVFRDGEEQKRSRWTELRRAGR
ncbi:MAG: hypothetical protein R8K46_00770 [Mariprofundaceae bacterium]